MSKRPPNDNPSEHSSGLLNTLESLGRTRGSSATPVQFGPSMLSPQPQQDIQTRVDSMSNEMGRTSIGQVKQNQTMIRSNRRGSQLQGRGGDHHRGQSSGARPGNSNQNQGVGYGNETRESSSSSGTQQSSSTQGTASLRGGPSTFKFPAGKGALDQVNLRVSYIFITYSLLY